MKSLVAKIGERPFVASILGVLFIAAVVTRVHLLDRSLWLDEAWVANAALAPSLREAIYYDAWMQTSPPLFIALTRFTALVFGVSNTTVRLVPALAGIASVVLIGFIAFKLLRPIFAAMAVFLFVFSPEAILYSQSLKQYSTDVLSACGLLSLGLLHLEKRSATSFYSALTGFLLLGFLSYLAVVFLPFLLYCALVRAGDVKSSEHRLKLISSKWLRVALAAAAGIVIGATNYYLFIAPNQNRALAKYFSTGFYRGEDLAGWAGFYASRLPSMTGVFFFHNPGWFEVALFAVALIGLGSLCLRGIRQRAGVHEAVLLITPVAGVIGLNLLRLYPLPSFDHRLLLFVSPISILLFCLGLQALAGFTASLARPLKAQTVENVVGGSGWVVLVGFLLLFFRLVGLEPFFAVEREQAEEAVGYLTQTAKPDDVLYVHASMTEQFKFYERLMPLIVNKVVSGNVGFPCCARKGYHKPRREPIRIIAEEIAGLSASATGRTLWFMVTNRVSHWSYSRRNDIEMFEFGLAKVGCQKVNGTDLVGVRIDQFECAPTEGASK